MTALKSAVDQFFESVENKTGRKTQSKKTFERREEVIRVKESNG